MNSKKSLKSLTILIILLFLFFPKISLADSLPTPSPPPSFPSIPIFKKIAEILKKIVDFLANFCGCKGNEWNMICWLACIGATIITLVIKAPAFFVAVVGMIMAFFGLIFLIISQSIANQLLFLSSLQMVGITEGIIANEVKTFANHIVVTFLYVIGLATVFRIAEYQARKTLVPLIVATLLINFSTPIVDTVVRIGNLLTDYFLSLAKGRANPPLDFVDWNYVSHLIKGFGNIIFLYFISGTAYDFLKFGPFIVTLSAAAVTPFIIALLLFMIAIVILTFGLVFLLRTIFLWILKIVAPIAFVTAAFRTREIKSIFVGPLNFDDWCVWLLEWSFIGVALAIWLFLAHSLDFPADQQLKLDHSATTAISTIIKENPLTTAQEGQGGQGSQGGQESQGGQDDPYNLKEDMANTMINAINTLLPHLTKTIILWIGITTAPGMMGKIANHFFQWAKQFAIERPKGYIKGVLMAGGIAGGAALIAGGKAFAGEVGKAFAEREPGIGGFLKAVGKGIGRGTRAGVGVATRRVISEVGAELVKPIPKEIRREIETIPWVKRREQVLITKEEEAEKFAEEAYNKGGVGELINVFKTEGIHPGVKEAVISKAIKEGEFDKMLQDKDIIEFLKQPKTQKQIRFQANALRIRPDLAKVFINPQTKQPWKIDEIMRNIPSSDILQIKEEALIDPDVISAMRKEQLEMLIEKGSPAQKDALKRGFAELLRLQTQSKVVLDTSSPEALKKDVSTNMVSILVEVEALKKSSSPEDQLKAEVIRKLANAIWQEKI